MQKFVSFPTIESGLYMFGGHRHTVNGGWSFFEQKHQVLELMVIVAGHQLTEIRDQTTIDLGPGDAVLIAPGTLHTNRNASRTQKMTYMCLHFDFEDVQLRSRIIGCLTNQLIPAETEIALKSKRMLTGIVELSRNKRHRNDFAVQVEIEILLLRYLKELDRLTEQVMMNKHQMLPFSGKEARVARDIALAIEERVNDDTVVPSFTFSDICHKLHISNGYGYKVFKRVYGITPLHFINHEKLKKAQRLLEHSENSIKKVAYKVGAANASIFSKQFKKWSGLTPSEYRKQTKRRN